MAISAKFEADFSQFVAESQKANASLSAIEGASKSVAASLGDLGSSCGWWGAPCQPEDKAKRDAAFDKLMDDNEKLIRGTTLAQWLPAGRSETSKRRSSG